MMHAFRSDNYAVREVFKRSGIAGKAALTLGLWFGAGLFPKAPGTFGTICAIPLIGLLHALGGPWEALGLAATVAAAVWASDMSRRLIGKPDPRVVVVDEVAGFALTMYLLPLSWVALVLGFVLFRAFDILKPYPIRLLEGVRGGAGIVLDDLGAGVYALLSTKILLIFAS